MFSKLFDLKNVVLIVFSRKGTHRVCSKYIRIPGFRADTRVPWFLEVRGYRFRVQLRETLILASSMPPKSFKNDIWLAVMGC